MEERGRRNDWGATPWMYRLPAAFGLLVAIIGIAILAAVASAAQP